MDKNRFTKWFRTTVFFKLNKYSIITMIISILLNYAGHIVSEKLNLPIWLDTVGTMIAAIQFGPIAGLIVGGISSLCTTIIEGGLYFFVIVGCMVGVVVGFLFPRNQKNDLLVVVSLAILSGLISTFICIPINNLYYDGYPGNSWGNALYEMLLNNVNNKYFNTFASEAFVDIPDRVISIFFAMFLVDIEETRILKKKHKKWSITGGALSILIIVFSVFLWVNLWFMRMK